MLLVIDNYDSFTYNLVQFLGELGAEMTVWRNDEATVEKVRELAPQAIVLSPGPCTPNEAGETCNVIRAFHETTPILGVCLGHQCIGAVMGGNVVRAPYLMHGKTSEVRYEKTPLLDGLSNPFTATRYHSLIVDRDSLPDSLRITAETDDGLIMAMEHKSSPLYGVQFHPESILTGEGKKLLSNFLDIAGLN